MMVDKWISEDWARQHALCRERRLMMPGPAHHQGSLSLGEYKKTWVSSLISPFFLKLYFEFLLIILLISWQSESHSGQSCNNFTTYAMSHMGRATSDVAYNPAAPPEAYTTQHPGAPHCLHGGGKVVPRGDLGSGDRATLRRSHHEGGRWEEARAVFDRKQLGRHGEYTQLLAA